MGGTSQQTQDTSQNSTNAANTNQTSLLQAMQNSNTSQNAIQSTNGSQQTGQAQTSSTNPWAAALPTVQGLLGQLNPLIANSGLSPTASSALDTMQANASQGNPFAAMTNNTTAHLLNGGGATDQNGNISDALSTYQKQLTPFASGSMVGSNPGLLAQLATIQNDVGNSVNSQFAAAGRDLSGANQQAYGRGVAQGQAPVIAAQYNQDVQNQLGAAGALYGAGNTTAGLLNGTNAQSNTNQQQGITNVPTALDANNYGANQTLAIEQLRQQLPAQNLGLLAQIGTPLAGLGSTSTGTTNGSTTNTGGTSSATNSNTSALNTTLAQALSNLYGTSSGTSSTVGTKTASPLEQATGWLNFAGKLGSIL